MHKKTCPNCGKEFETRFKNRKYCSDECAVESHKEQCRAYREAKKNGKANLYAPKLTQKKKKANADKKNGKRVSLMDEYIKARENGTHGGLTYGYWVARRYAEGRDLQRA